MRFIWHANALLKLPDDQRTQTLTRHQLADALTGHLQFCDSQTANIATLLDQADEHATVLSDGARALGERA